MSKAHRLLASSPQQPKGRTMNRTLTAGTAADRPAARRLRLDADRAAGARRSARHGAQRRARPGGAANAPLELKRANDSLTRADNLLAKGEPLADINSAAYVARQQARTAQAIAQRQEQRRRGRDVAGRPRTRPCRRAHGRGRARAGAGRCGDASRRRSPSSRLRPRRPAPPMHSSRPPVAAAPERHAGPADRARHAGHARRRAVRVQSRRGQAVGPGVAAQAGRLSCSSTRHARS